MVHISDVATALAISRTDAAKRLARWREQGWLSRVGAGAYVPASIDTLGSDRVLDDAWVLVPALFSPAYIAGRTAAEHWDLTEQIFKDIIVVTGQAVRRKRQTRQGFEFTLKHLSADKIFGTKPVWRHHTKVPVSDVHRTIIDMLDDPALGGGIQHVADCLKAYCAREIAAIRSSLNTASASVMAQSSNDLVFLRRDCRQDGLAESCRERLTAGNSKLDPALDGHRLVSRWRLLIPESWSRGDSD